MKIESQSPIFALDLPPGAIVALVKGSEVEGKMKQGFELKYLLGPGEISHPMFSVGPLFLMVLNPELAGKFREAEFQEMKKSVAALQTESLAWQTTATNVLGQLRDLTARTRSVDRTPKGVKEFAETCLGAATSHIGDTKKRFEKPRVNPNEVTT